MILQVLTAGPGNTSTGPMVINAEWAIGTPINSITQQTIPAGVFTGLTAPPAPLVPYVVVIVPPTTLAAQTWIVKSTVGDTGIAMGNSQSPAVLGIGSAFPVGILLSAGSNQTFTTIWL